MQGNISISRRSRRSSLARVAVSALLAALFALPAAGHAQQNAVSGTVVDGATGAPLEGVAVGVVGTTTGTRTNAAGRYTVQAAPNGSLAFSRIGYSASQVNIAGRSTVDVRLQVSVAVLDELVVTGYQTQRRADITTAVATVNVEAVERQASSSVLQRLAGAVPGVTVETSGSPGARSTVRIRGVSSFQNNSPLYIIDGTPVEEQFANFLNPHDVESIQVLKDASAASIYGARATNGVVIITTKKGRRAGMPQVSVDANYGIANPIRGYDDFLISDPLQYFEVIRRSYVNAGQAVPSTFTSIYGDPNNPSIPAYIYAAPSTIQARDAFGRPTTVNTGAYAYPNTLIMPGSQGTNWWDAVFGTGEVRDVNLAVRGGAEAARYSVGLNYFDQLGTAAYNRYQRGTARVNTDFSVGRFTVGENLSVAFEEAYGGQAGDNFGEGGIIGKNILSQPVVPIYDINGNFASGKSPGLGNNTNPLKSAYAARDNRNTNSRIFGNIYGRLAITDGLSYNTSLGINAGTGGTRGFNDITPENSEPNFANSIFENSNTFTSYTWNNTLNFQQTFAENHNLSLLAGQEAIRSRSRNISGGISSLVSTVIDARYIQDALGDPATKTVSSSGGVSSLLSFFGKADYNFAERYYVSGTLRRDGSSRLADGNQWGTFPAFSLGWRVSQEPFMQDNALISNMMLRFGYGITGNQNIASGRTVAAFGGSTGISFYDISGTNAIVTGYRQSSIGNPDLRWEENVSTNIGMDLEFLDGNATLVLDLYQRDSNDLLFDPPLPGTAGLASPPIVNVGQMRNRGIDGSVGLRGSFSDAVGWSMDLNASHYRNEIMKIDGAQNFFFGPIGTRFASSVTINEVGKPIGSFYGYVKEGTFQNQQEIDGLNASARQATGATAATVYQTGAKPGRFRFKDTNNDGRVTALDRTTIGSPHPDFTSGLNLGLNWNNFDLGADFFGTFGNEIYDAQKEFYVFRLFNTNVREDILTDSWTPETPDAKYPRLDVTDDFSRDPSSFYVEDGSYVRMRSLQLGYTVPSGRIRGFDNIRVYVRGENLFTLTGYDGLDPSLPALNANRSGMDITDQARGIDRGTYPTNRTLSMGFGIGF